MTSQDPNHARRQEIILAARNVFLQHGYTATSMDRVATATGLAKQTLYNHFGSKENLFSEVIRHGTANFLIPLEEHHDNFTDLLHHFAHAFRALLLGTEGLAMYRMLIAEAGRFPDLARTIYLSGPGATLQRLSQAMAKAMEQGILQPGDPQFAADMLLSMLAGLERTLLLLGELPPTPEEESRRLTNIITTFMNAFAPNRAASEK